jgi:hypothetical protein
VLHVLPLVLLRQVGMLLPLLLLLPLPGPAAAGWPAQQVLVCWPAACLQKKRMQGHTHRCYDLNKPGSAA